MLVDEERRRELGGQEGDGLRIDDGRPSEGAVGDAFTAELQESFGWQKEFHEKKLLNRFT